MDAQEVRIWLCGTECILRPVSAGAYLRQRRESRELFLKNDGGRVPEQLVSAACAAVQGIWDGEVQLFHSTQEALDRLTVEELLMLAEAFGLPDALQTGGNDETASMAFPEETSGRRRHFFTEETVMREHSDVQRAAKRPQTDARRMTEHAVEKEDSLTSEQWYTDDVQKSKKEVYINNADRRYVNRKYSEDFGSYEVLRKEIVDIKSISDQLERDGRRYSGAFLKYE